LRDWKDRLDRLDDWLLQTPEEAGAYPDQDQEPEETIETRFQNLEYDLTGLNDYVNDRFQELEERIDSLRNRVSYLENRLAVLEER